MSRFILSVSLLALIAGGCDDNNNNTTSQAYEQAPMRAKPVVAIVPVMDNTKNDLNWNLSDELSSSLYERISQRNHLLLVDASKVRSQVKKLGEKHNPFGPDISWVKKSFQGDQYVVFLELVEHEEVINQNKKRPSDPKNCNAELNMSMRVRVFDLRDTEPKIILQELIHDTHFIPRQFTQANFYQVPWGDPSFSISPIGLAHANFTKEVASRIEEYVMTMSKK
ncbi:MAG: hypothetical protein JSS60_03220 [Verrucomicrobia bacterium]|nr:hypothetical protein [Verrucomicrobiota bacterium]